MRGLVPQDGLFGGSGYRGSRNERGRSKVAAHSAVADSLLTLPSPARCSSTDVGGLCPRSVALLREPGRGSTWSTRSAASMNDVDHRRGPGEPLACEDSELISRPPPG